jgi:Fe-S-cluster containining protein
MWRLLTEEIRKLHAFFDDDIGKWCEDFAGRGGRTFCGKGCRECCTLAVNCSFTEALCIAESLSEGQAAGVREHVARLGRHIHEATDLKSYLRLHRQKIGFCPFLDMEGTCGIYSKRPFSCRSLISTKESRWCGADFSQLSSAEKRAFVESLDTSVVAFPMHYVAAIQELGQELESHAALRMRERLGFSLYGSLPFLVYLELEHGLSRVAKQGYDATLRMFERNGLLLPYLVSFDAASGGKI